MMYKEKMVAVVKVDDKILREDKDTVYIPFGAEYSLMFRNLESKKAVVSISIDGTDVMDGGRIVVNANSTATLERFLSHDMNKGNRFKFIQKTEKIQEHRGDKVDDGLIRIEFQYEKPIEPHNQMIFRGYGAGGQSVNSCATDMSRRFKGSLSMEASLARPAFDEGITVAGSESRQSFRTASVGELEPEKHVMVFQLKGVMPGGTEVTEALTVDVKVVCPTCGDDHKSTAKYCSECGTYLM